MQANGLEVTTTAVTSTSLQILSIVSIPNYMYKKSSSASLFINVMTHTHTHYVHDTPRPKSLGSDENSRPNLFGLTAQQDPIVLGLAVKPGLIALGQAVQSDPIPIIFSHCSLSITATPLYEACSHFFLENLKFWGLAPLLKKHSYSCFFNNNTSKLYIKKHTKKMN